ncbi:hypothetical protein C8R44DRAFT_740146 [Mycena epipterygia]|nr:hypothetical protein C8R44DRAFT_740146 [Mycena epipterygia]
MPITAGTGVVIFERREFEGFQGWEHKMVKECAGIVVNDKSRVWSGARVTGTGASALLSRTRSSMPRQRIRPESLLIEAARPSLVRPVSVIASAVEAGPKSRMTVKFGQFRLEGANLAIDFGQMRAELRGLTGVRTNCVLTVVERRSDDKDRDADSKSDFSRGWDGNSRGLNGASSALSIEFCF